MNSLVTKYKRQLMLVGLVVVLGLLAFLRWTLSYSSTKKAHKEKQEAMAKAQETPAINAFLVKKVNFIENLTLTGNIQGGARVECRFNRDGRISRINYRVGEKVKRGAIIAELETGEAKIKLEQMEAELSQAVDLYKAGAIAKPKLTQSQLAAELARKEYERSFIRAARDGSIGELNAEVGETVTPQLTVAALVSTENVFVEMGIIEKDLDKLHLGQTVDCEVETYPGLVFKGKISQISPQVEGTSRTRTVRAEFVNNKEMLLPGMFTRAKIFIQEIPNVLTVPSTAVRDVSGKKHVYVISDKNKLESHPIELGYEGVDYSVIKSGINEGQKVVETQSNTLRDGMTVDIVEVKEYNEKKLMP